MTGLSNATGLSATSSSLILTAKGMAGSAGLSSGSGLGGGIASLAFDFSTGVLPAGVTFTRASAAWGFNSAGVLTSYANNVPRFVYDPVTLASLGLLVEGPRTNSIRNSTAVGAVTGTPGTAPTNWTQAGASPGQEIVGTGTEDGIDYVDWRIVGSGTSSYALSAETHTAVAAAAGQVWMHSVYLRLMAGSMANIGNSSVSPRLTIRENTAGGTNIISGMGDSFFGVTNAPLRTQRFTCTRTLTDATTGAITPQLLFSFTVGQPVDITLRIGLPQLEKSELTGSTTALAGASSPIKTSTVAVARALDFAQTPAAYKTVIVRARTPSADPITVGQPPFGISDNTFINMMTAVRISPTSFQASCTTSFANQCTLEVGASSINADFGLAVRFENNNFGASLNGGPVATDLVGTIPPTANVLSFGVSSASTNNMWFSTIKSIELRSSATDAELQTLSAAPAGLTDAELWMTAIGANV